MTPTLFRPGNLALVLLCLVQTACVPMILEMTPHVHGRVTNARTHAPVALAHVAFLKLSVPTTVTDADGHFDLAATHELRLVLFMPGDRFGPNKLAVSHPGYSPITYTFSYGINRPADIRLNPIRR